MKELIKDYKRRITTLETDFKLFLSNGSTNDIKRVERLTTKLYEYRAFVTELERVQRENTPDVQDIPRVCETIHTVGQLKAFLSVFKDNDIVVMETIDLETGDVQDLYPFHMDIIDGIKLADDKVGFEIRFCQETNI